MVARSSSPPFVPHSSLRRPQTEGSSRQNSSTRGSQSMSVSFATDHHAVPIAARPPTTDSTRWNSKSQKTKSQSKTQRGRNQQNHQTQQQSLNGIKPPLLGNLVNGFDSINSKPVPDITQDLDRPMTGLNPKTDEDVEIARQIMGGESNVTVNTGPGRSTNNNSISQSRSRERSQRRGSRDHFDSNLSRSINQQQLQASDRYHRQRPRTSPTDSQNSEQESLSVERANKRRQKLQTVMDNVNSVIEATQQQQQSLQDSDIYYDEHTNRLNGVATGKNKFGNQGSISSLVGFGSFGSNGSNNSFKSKTYEIGDEFTEDEDIHIQLERQAAAELKARKQYAKEEERKAKLKAKMIENSNNGNNSLNSSNFNSNSNNNMAQFMNANGNNGNHNGNTSKTSQYVNLSPVAAPPPLPQGHYSNKINPEMDNSYKNQQYGSNSNSKNQYGPGPGSNSKNQLYGSASKSTTYTGTPFTGNSKNSNLDYTDIDIDDDVDENLNQQMSKDIEDSYDSNTFDTDNQNYNVNINRAKSPSNFTEGSHKLPGFLSSAKNDEGKQEAVNPRTSTSSAAPNPDQGATQDHNDVTGRIGNQIRNSTNTYVTGNRLVSGLVGKMKSTKQFLGIGKESDEKQLQNVLSKVRTLTGRGGSPKQYTSGGDRGHKDHSNYSSKDRSDDHDDQKETDNVTKNNSNNNTGGGSGGILSKIGANVGQKRRSFQQFITGKSSAESTESEGKARKRKTALFFGKTESAGTNTKWFIDDLASDGDRHERVKWELRAYLSDRRRTIDGMLRSIDNTEKRTDEDLLNDIKAMGTPQNMMKDEDDVEAAERLEYEELIRPKTRRRLFMRITFFIYWLSIVLIGLEVNKMVWDDMPKKKLGDRLPEFLIECVLVLFFSIELVLRVRDQGYTYLNDYLISGFCWLMNLIDLFTTLINSNSDCYSGGMKLFYILRIWIFVDIDAIVHIFPIVKDVTRTFYGSRHQAIRNGILWTFGFTFWFSQIVSFVFCSSFDSIQMFDTQKTYQKISGWNIMSMYDTTQLSFFQVLQIFMGHSIQQVWRPSMEYKKGSGVGWFFVFFIVYVIGALTLLNVLAGQIVALAMLHAEQNQSFQVQREQKEMQATMLKLEDILEAVRDAFDESGLVDTGILIEVFETKQVKKIFDICNVPLDDVIELMDLLDRDNVGSVNIDEFLGACTRLRGDAKSRDVYTLKLATDSMTLKFSFIEKRLRQAQRMMIGLENAISKIEIIHKKTIRSADSQALPGRDPKIKSSMEHCLPMYPDIMTEELK